jgi:hypothetical protein
MPKLQLIVPAYFYPSGRGTRAWQRMMEAASKIKIVAIVNPANGAGEERNPEYPPVLQAARDKGIKIIGYVSSNYGKRMLPEIKREIDRWVQFYPQIHGFFIDQQSTEARDVTLYAAICYYARQRVKDALLINNPGTMCDESYFTQGVCDVTCVFSNFEGFSQLNLPAPLWQYQPSRFAALAYQVSDLKAMRQVVADSLVKRIGYLYVSDAPKGDNPWAELPTYWEDEVEAVSRAN